MALPEGGWRVPLFDVDFGEAELAAVAAPIRDGWLTMGPVTERFEAAFAAAAGARHAVAVANGTAALHLALAAAGIGPGDEVIVPSLTFVASANAARTCGARVVFAEVCGEADLGLDPEDVARRLTPRTRAIVAVHYAGFPAHVEELAALARERGLVLVEDAAHALLTTLGGRALGTFGTCGCFSFFSNKNFTCGEGGMIVTADEEIARRLRLLRSHGMTALTVDRHAGRAFSYDCLETGWNLRLDEIRASLALAQLARLPGFLEGRRRVRRWYLEGLAGLPVVVPFTNWDRREDAAIGYHIQPILLPPGADRRQVMERLRDAGIQSSIHYPPAHLFTAAANEGHPPLPRTEALAARELTLPFYPRMTQEQVAMVCNVLAAALEEQRVTESTQTARQQ